MISFTEHRPRAEAIRLSPGRFGKERLTNPIFLFNASVLVAFAILGFVAEGYAPEAATFPKFVLRLGMGVVAFWMVIYFGFPRAMQLIEAEEERDEEEGEAHADRGRFYRVWCCIAMAVLTGYLFGFLFLVPAAFLGYGLLLGERGRIRSLVLFAALATGAIYFTFDYVLNVPLLKGVFLDYG